MNRIKHGSKGFTLVELIVVIAIIAILTAVVLPSLSRYIDQARFSNDTQAAQSMTSILKNHMIVTGEDDYDGHDIRAIIDEYHGSTFNYTPSANNTGYFYVASTQEIIAAKYDDAEDLVEVNASHHMLLNDALLNGGGEEVLPEELFGDGLHLLTREGAGPALAVQFVEMLARSGSRLSADYDLGLDEIDDWRSSFLTRIFGTGMSEAIEAKVTNYLENTYNPEKVLFINNTNWSTGATDPSTIERIVFEPGISNIPAYNLGSRFETLEIDKLTLPRTVKTIEDGAFPEGLNITSLSIKGNGTLLLESETVLENITEVIGSRTTSTFEPEELLDSEGQPFQIALVESGGNYTIDLVALKNHFQANGIVVTAYNIRIDLLDESNYKIDVYTKDGYLGYIGTYVPE